MTDEELEAERKHLVVKSNTLIRENRFNLSVVEQKIILYIISKINNQDDRELREVAFSIKDFCEVCGITYKQNLSQLKATIKELADKSMWLKLGNGRETLIRWIEKPYIEYDSGIVRMRLDRDLMPYLLELRGNFTQYELIAVLALKSKYSIRLYELFKSYEYQGKCEFSIEELKKILLIDKEYKTTADFKRYVVENTIDEINSYTDIYIEYENIKTGRKITGFRFTIVKEDEEAFDGTKLFLNGVLPSRYQQKKRFKEFLKELENGDTDE